jgi:hypothetical protein
MKIWIKLFIMLLFCSNNVAISLIFNNDINMLDNTTLALQNITDSLSRDSTIITNNNLRVPQSDFMYSDNQRVTINGNLPLLETEIDPLRFGIFAGALTSFLTYQHIYQVNTIWSEKSDFRFIEDGNYALYSDKIGHFYGAYFSGYTYTEMLMWSGFSKETATLTGAIMGVAYSTYVEVMDGYAADWGFSPSDFYSDLGGFGFLLLQHYVPWFQNITPKFMYIPAEWHGERRRSPSEFFIDDYSSQSLYFSFNVYNMLPENMKKYWVPWLQLTVGYAARNLANPSDPNSVYLPEYSTKYGDIVAGSPRVIIGLDYDLVKLLPDGIPLWNWIRQTLNFIKFPAPAIEISEKGTRFLIMYPFLPL